MEGIHQYQWGQVLWEQILPSQTLHILTQTGNRLRENAVLSTTYYLIFLKNLDHPGRNDGAPIPLHKEVQIDIVCQP